MVHKHATGDTLSPVQKRKTVITVPSLDLHWWCQAWVHHSFHCLSCPYLCHRMVAWLGTCLKGDHMQLRLNSPSMAVVCWVRNQNGPCRSLVLSHQDAHHWSCSKVSSEHNMKAGKIEVYKIIFSPWVSFPFVLVLNIIANYPRNTNFEPRSAELWNLYLQRRSLGWETL